MGLLDENFELDVDFLVFFDILNVNMPWNGLFEQNIFANIGDKLVSVSVEQDSMGRMRPNKEDIRNVVYDIIGRDWFLHHRVSTDHIHIDFSSGTIDTNREWQSKPIFEPHLFITVSLDAFIWMDDGGSLQSPKIVSISLRDKYMMSQPKWIKERDQRMKKYL